MKKRNASATLYLVIFITMILAFCAFAVDGTIIFTTRSKLQNATEATALAAASEFNYAENATEADLEVAVIDNAKNTFNALKFGPLKFAKINVDVNASKKEVKITTTCPSPTFFLGLLGVSVVNLNAESAAQSEALDVTAKYSNINWITSSALYLSDILSKGLNLNDTAILLPLGNFPSASYSKTVNMVDFKLIDFDTTNQPLSLGPGGFITIKLPAPIVDKPGDDLFIKEIGAIEGYMVFAGIDNNPEKPYVNYQNTGDGLSWVNISCTGTPEIKDTDGLIGAYSATTQLPMAAQDKFYGSGYFDVGASCTDGFKGISMAKYIRIVDDNDESGFVTNSVGTLNSNKYYKAKFYGESSTPTVGADIDYVQVLNHVKLIPPSSYVDKT